MSTRAVYTFKDQDQTIHVYKHHDGYPTGAAQWIAAALPHAWPLPRFEANEFSAAFVAGNKGGNGGGVRLIQSGDVREVAPGDIEYRYEISQGKDGALRVKAWDTNYWHDPREESLIIDCRLDKFAAEADKYEKAAAE